MAEESCSRVRSFAWPLEPPAYEESAQVDAYGNVLVDLSGGLN